jgi:hypothetical protein
MSGRSVLLIVVGSLLFAGGLALRLTVDGNAIQFPFVLMTAGGIALISFGVRSNRKRDGEQDRHPANVDGHSGNTLHWNLSRGWITALFVVGLVAVVLVLPAAIDGMPVGIVGIVLAGLLISVAGVLLVRNR